MEIIKIKDEEKKTNSKMVNLINYYAMDNERIRDTIFVLRDKYSEFINTLYDNYNIDKESKVIRFNQEGDIEVLDKEEAKEE